MSTHPLEEMENYPTDYKTYNFVLSSATFHYALDQALQTVTSMDDLVVICTSHSLEELKTILSVEKMEEEWKVNTNHGFLTLDVEEELVDRVLAFQKITEVIEPDIERTASVVLMNYCLDTDEDVEIVDLGKVAQAKKELDENPELRESLNRIFEEAFDSILGVKDENEKQDFSNPLLEHALNNFKKDEK